MSMNRPLFVSLDGPKGTGKTTLLEALTQVLRTGGRKVIRLSERNNDPQRAATMAMVNQLARHPDPERELLVCERLADSRAWISRHVLPRQPAGSILLMDRWYPSEAAFRRLVPFADVLQMNMEREVWVPDLAVGVITRPEISWARAAARSRGLGSTVIRDAQEHADATEAFERVVLEQGWLLCRNEAGVEEATQQVAGAILKVIAAGTG